MLNGPDAPALCPPSPNINPLMYHISLRISSTSLPPTHAGGGHDLLSGLVRGVRRAHDGTFTAHFEVPGDLGLGMEGDLGGAAARGLNAVAELLQSGGWAAAGGNRRNRTFRWAAGWGSGGPLICF